MAINSISNGIGTRPQNISDNQQSQQVNSNTGQQGASNASVTSTDTVSLTGTASQLRALEQQISSLPIVDVQRVNSIKQEISSGSYVIDPPKVADKMIQIESAINERLV